MPKQKEKVQIKKMVIQMGKKEVTLSIEEARELQQALNEIFDREVKVVKEEHHHHHSHREYPWWPRDIFRDDIGVFKQMDLSPKISYGSETGPVTMRLAIGSSTEKEPLLK